MDGECEEEEGEGGEKALGAGEGHGYGGHPHHTHTMALSLALCARPLPCLFSPLTSPYLANNSPHFSGVPPWPHLLLRPVRCVANPGM